jgi:molybdopterin-guanine dinucleotide biosynthesis protein A
MSLLGPLINIENSSSKDRILPIIIIFMITIAIQAGGNSRRMGQDKALLPFLGKPLILRIIDRILPLADEIIITTNQPDNYKFLDVPLYPDVFPDRGALGGLYTALYFARFPLVGVVACDMPFVNLAMLTTMCSRLEGTDADVILPRNKYGYEPLHAIYRRDTCLLAVQGALDQGEWRLISWIDSVSYSIFSIDEVQLFDPDGLAFWNLNTPEEFQAAQSKAMNE